MTALKTSHNITFLRFWYFCQLLDVVFEKLRNFRFKSVAFMFLYFQIVVSKILFESTSFVESLRWYDDVIRCFFRTNFEIPILHTLIDRSIISVSKMISKILRMTWCILNVLASRHEMHLVMDHWMYYVTTCWGLKEGSILQKVFSIQAFLYCHPYWK